MSARVEVRPATRADVEAFLPEPLPWRVRAFTGLLDGEIVGIGGLAYLPDGTVMAFLHGSDKARACRLSLHKAARRVLSEARGKGLRTIVAEADHTIEPAERWLLRLGFKPVDHDGERVYVWHSSH